MEEADRFPINGRSGSPEREAEMAQMAVIWFLRRLLEQLLAYPEVVLAIAAFVVLRWVRREPGMPTNWPVVGMLPAMMVNTPRIHEWSAEVLRRAGGTLVFKGPWFAGMDLLATADPANVAYITSTVHAGNYPKGTDYTEMFDILGDGILNADGDLWRVQRRWAHSVMRQMRFRRYVSTSGRKKVESGLLPVLAAVAEHGGAVDLQEVMQRYTFDATCIFVCGVDPGCLSPAFPLVPFAQAVDAAKEVIHLRHTVPKPWWKALRRLRLGQEAALARAATTVDACIAAYISKNKHTPKEEHEADLLSSYMEYREDEEMERMKSDKFLRDVILNMLVAGRDTTSAALTWFFWELSRNPAVEARILEELRAELREEEGGRTQMRVFSVEELAGLVYLHAALSECLRLYPPVPIVHKCATVTDTFPSGHRVRPGTKVYYCLYALARMETVWGKDCREFRPERWISSVGTLKSDHSNKFFTFNAGPRSCLGKGISFSQMKMVVAAVLYNFHVQVLEDQVVCPTTSMILHTKNGLKVKLRRR